MKIFSKTVFMLLPIFLTLSACARSSSTNESPKTLSITINGEQPDVYFKRFLYRTIGSCVDATVYFHYLNSEDATLESDVSGKPMKAVVEVFLYDNNTFLANYEERSVKYYVPNGYGFEVVFRKRLTGQWVLNKDGQIVLEGLGVGSGIQYNDRPGVLLSTEQNIHQLGFKNQKILLRMVMTRGSSELANSVCK